MLRYVNSLTLIIESIYSVDACTFVVSSEEEEILGILDLVGQKEANGLHRLLPSVNIVPKEEVVGIWRESAILKQPEEVTVLAVDIS